MEPRNTALADEVLEIDMKGKGKENKPTKKEKTLLGNLILLIYTLENLRLYVQLTQWIVLFLSFPLWLLNCKLQAFFIALSIMTMYNAPKVDITNFLTIVIKLVRNSPPIVCKNCNVKY